MSLICGNSRTSPLNCPSEIFAPMQDLPSCVTMIHVPLQRPSFGLRLHKRMTGASIVEIFRCVPYVYFITLPCILLLTSLCFSFTCTLLTLLQLRYILWGFIVYFRIIFWYLTCAFLLGIQDFMHLLCTIIGHDISNNLITSL